MNLKAFIPTPAEFGREALILLGGALIAAFLMRQLPSVRQYIREAWGSQAGTPDDRRSTWPNDACHPATNPAPKRASSKSAADRSARTPRV